MWKPLANSIDVLLSMTLSRYVRPPSGELPCPTFVPNDVDSIEWPSYADLKFAPAEQHPHTFQSRFSFPSPVPSLRKENDTVRGLAIGPPDARDVTILLHAAYEDSYTHMMWMAESFVRHGQRVYIPACPHHLERAPSNVFSGSPMFWSAELVVAGLYQWLAEIRGLIGYLRLNGVERIGVYGYSLGSLVAGLAATLWADLDFVAMLSPVGSHLDAIRHSRVAARIWPWMSNLPQGQMNLLRRWAPLQRQPVVDRLGFFITLHDQLQPTVLQEKWWQAWHCPTRWDYAHSHLSVHYCKTFYQDLSTFAAQSSAGDEHASVIAAAGNREVAKKA